MKTTQAWGWLTAGVLALGLNGIYHDGGAEWAHRIVNHVGYSSAAVVALASGRADQFLEQARLVARDNTQSCPLGTAMARIQARVARTETGWARFESMSARDEAQLARVEANRARVEAALADRSEFAAFVEPVVFQAQKASVICPRVRVKVPRVPMIKMQAPVVHVGAMGTGPV